MSDDAPGFSADQERMLTTLLDAIIPASADGRLPAAGALDLTAHIARSVERTPMLRSVVDYGLSSLAELARKRNPAGWAALSTDEHQAAMGELFRQRWHSPMGPLRSLIEADVPVALGSDGPMNPFLNIMFAVTDPTNPSEAITREQAVSAYTVGSAFAEFAEADKGTIAVGKLADIAVLSQDPFSVPIPDLPKTHSVLTIVGGKIVYEEH